MQRAGLDRSRPAALLAELSRWAGLKKSAGVAGSSYLLVLRAVGPKLVVGLAHPRGDDDESVLVALKAGARSCR
jgi:hypothetical protein